MLALHLETLNGWGCDMGLKVDHLSADKNNSCIYQGQRERFGGRNTKTNPWQKWHICPTVSSMLQRCEQFLWIQVFRHMLRKSV